MTEKDKLNWAYHERILGECVHEFEWRYNGRVYCKKPKCDKVWTAQPTVAAYIPDYANDKAVLWECVVKLAEAGKYLVKLIDGKYAICDSSLDQYFECEDPNPNHAVIMAVLKMEGGEV